MTKKRIFCVAATTVALAAIAAAICCKGAQKNEPMAAKDSVALSTGDISGEPMATIKDSAAPATGGISYGDYQKLTDAMFDSLHNLKNLSDGDYEKWKLAYEKWRLAMLKSLRASFDKLRDGYIQKIVIEQNPGNLSMKDLVILRSSVYAANGLYFMDENLNSYFMNEKNPTLPWYRNYMCFLLESAHYKAGDGFVTAEKDVKLSASEKQFVEKLDRRIADVRKSDMYVNKNGYTVGNTAHIVNLHKIKNLDKNFMSKLAQNNFAIVDTGHLQLFHVYEQNNYERMPSFVTTDLFLQAFHMYLSYALKKLEQEKFIPALEELTLGLYGASMNLVTPTNTELSQIAEHNAAFYAISYTLLTGKKLKVPAQYQDSYDEEVGRAAAAAEDGVSSAFLDDAVMHYTLFKPRGHYTRKPETEAYFKAMMWLQKAYFCREKNSHLKQCIFTASLLNTAKTAKGKPLLDVYASIFEPTALLIGEPNNLSVMDIAQFLKNENTEHMPLALSADNVESVNQMLTGLAGRIIIAPKALTTCLDKINFMPQRYLIDNEILQEMADTSLNAERAFPKGLDVFSAFGSEPAGDVLNNFYKEKEKWGEYPKEIAKLQKKFKNFDGWNKSTYNKWIESLLALQKKDKGYPAFMKTKAWDYKNLNTSLASWAELKHDFILYADQPYAAESGGCDEYYLPEPDRELGYVEPNALFWNKLNELITLTRNMLAKHNLLDNELKTKSEKLQDFVTFLIDASKKELANKPLSAEEHKRIAVIGGAVENFTLSVLDPDGLGGGSSWWLVQGPDRSIAVAADIYTRNIPGDPKNGVLHAATGKANEIYVVVEINGYLYLTKGATFSYYEFVMPQGSRLTDEEWQKIEEDKSKRPATSEWMRSVIVDGNSQPDIIPNNYHSTSCFEDCY
ncbi:MAG: DUF3160 domain-containing protein [Chitinispirillales bacterium]|jgi:hypothetical protein|nr:DUF3160 domain-containing protein [Chitinispirillales bacterium]